MSAASYPEAIRRVLLSEGGYVNHPSDPGGPTNFGITLADYRKYVKPDATAADVRAMNVNEAKTIYRTKYWAAVRGDDDPAGLDYTLFDYGVNSGTSRANKVLQRVVGVAVTGQIDNVTLAAVKKRDPKAIISEVNAERLRFLQGLKTWPVFGKGWGTRVSSVNAAALKMAALGDAPIPSAMPEPPPPSTGKGEVPKPSTGKIIVGTGAPTGATGGATWWDWIAAHPYESAFIAIAALAALIVVVEWAATKWQASKQDAPTPGLIPVPETKAITV